MEPTKEERHTLTVDLRSHEAEEHLTKEALAGDKEAFEALFRIHHAGCLRVASSYVRSSPDAEDVVQESFIKAWRAMDRFDLEASFGPWIRTIVANEARSNIRANSRRKAAGDRLETHLSRVQQSAPSVEELLLLIETRSELDEAISELSPGDQRVIRLRYQLGFSESEMAAQLEVPPGTVKSRLSRALVRLRDHMVVVILVLLAMTAVAVPQVRAAIGDLLGITGSEKVVRVPQLPEDLSSRPFDWGPAVDLDQVGRLNPFGSDLPLFKGIEPEIHLRTDLQRPLLTLVYGNDSATIMGGAGPIVLAKLVPPSVRVRQVQTPNGRGLWIAGGADHALAALDPANGGYARGPKTRIDSGVLAFEGQDGRDYRVQTKRGLQHALDLVRVLIAASK